MNSKHRRPHTMVPSFFQNPFQFRLQARPRSRRAARRLLYLESLESRVLLSAQSVANIAELAHHNTPLTLNLADFSNAFSDTNGGTLALIEFTAPPSHGRLTLNGSDAVFDQAIPISDIASLTYIPNGNYVGPDVFDWNGSDGIAFADASAQVSVTVQEFAPVLRDVYKYVPLNTTTAFQASDFTVGFSDADPGDSLQAIQIASLPTQGSLMFFDNPAYVGETVYDISSLTYVPSSNYTGSDNFYWNAIDGTLSAVNNARVNISSSDAPLVSDLNLTAHRNSPLSFNLADFSNALTSFSGGALSQIEFTALPTDGTLSLNGSAVTLDQVINVSDLPGLSYLPNANYTGMDVIGWNGSDGIAFANAPANINLDVQEFAPTLHDVRRFIPLNTVTAFRASDFTAGFADPDSGDSLQAITITSLPAQGSLLFNGDPVSPGLTIAVDQIPSLSYVPPTDYTGADSFTWNASDGTLFANTDATVNISVSATPLVFDINKDAHHDTTLNFTAADFTSAFLDADNQALQSIQITALPSNGTLMFEGSPVTLYQLIDATLAADITYVPDTGFSGLDTIGWNGYDASMPAGAPALININVTEAAPTVANSAKTVARNVVTSFTASDFTAYFSDADPGDTLRSIRLTTLPGNGTLALNGTPVALNQVILAGVISYLDYTPAPGYTGPDVIGWTGSDGSLFADPSAVINLTVQDVPPTLSDVTKNSGKNVTFAFSLGDFTASFTGPSAADTLQSLKIVSLPNSGTLKLLNGTTSTAVTAGQILTLSQIPQLTYTPNTGFLGSDSFTWNASDGPLFAVANANVNITISDTQPVLNPISIAINQNSTLTINSKTFTNAFTDADPGDAIVQAMITALPTYGTLKLAGVPVYDYQTIAASQLGKLSYTPNPNFAGTDTMYWSASDGQQFAASKVINFNVSGKAPTVAAFAKGVIQNSTGVAFGSWDFISAFTDPNVGPSLRSITVSSLPTHGTLTLNGAAVTKGQVITCADTNSADQLATLIYMPNAGYVGSDAFSWKGSDGIATSSNAATVSLTVLSSSGLVISGGGNIIPSGSTLTSPVNFTNFGNIGYYTNQDNQLDTRIYTITNNSTASITFTGKPALIQIKGNTTDFFASAGFTDTLFNATTSTLLPGHSATFTVTFMAQLALKRSATVTIPVSSGPALTFNVAGLGINTINNNDTSNVYGSPDYYGPTALNGLQYATTKAGSGPYASEGDVLTMNYTGYLLNGTLFDSSLNPGRTPFQFYLGPVQTGNSNVIVGWNPGLLGIQLGEQRTLIIPSSIAYGVDGGGTIPPNSCLIFYVQCVGIGSSRVGAGVSGNMNYITPQSTTASTLEGTNFGALSATQSSVTTTFSIYSTGYSDPTGTYSAGLFFTSNNPITLTGPNASDFVLVATSGTFSVTFNKPADTKPRTAKITIYTTDPVNPAFFFTLQGSAAPYVDLTPTLGTTNLHLPTTTITSGDRTNLALPLTITNLGNVTSTGKTDIQVFAVNTTTHTQTLITTLTNQSMSGIAAHKSQTRTLNVTLPVGFSAGNYQLAVQLNASGALAESNYSNNSATTTPAFTVNQGLADLTGTLVSDALPPAIVANTTVNSSITVLVANQGNVLLPANQQVNVVVLAHNVDTQADIVLTTSAALSVASLKPGAASKFTIPFKYNAGLPAGHYILETQINPVQTLSEFTTANNLVTLNASGQQLTLVSAAPFYDLAGTLGTSKLPTSLAAGASLTGAVHVTVSNLGNIALPSGQQIQIQLVAHPAAGADFPLLTSAPLSVASLKPGASLNASLSVKLPAGPTAGSYILQATIVPLPALVEDSTDNVITLTAAGATIPLTVT